MTIKALPFNVSHNWEICSCETTDPVGLFGLANNTIDESVEMAVEITWLTLI